MTDPSFTIRDALERLVNGNDLAEAEAAAIMEQLMTGEATPAQFGAFVMGLRIKGETVDEIAGMAKVMREKSLRIDVEGPVLDTCGTGGDASGSFNVSTCAAFVAAGAGARVAKHGNRAMTSQCGSADVLEALGARIDLGPAQVAACIERAGIGFMFAQGFHPAMKHVGPARREIGIRTVFNLLGPLTNPAGAHCQVLGVARRELVEKLAEVLARLGSYRALVVHGDDGFDELSITGPSTVAELAEGAVRTFRVAPEDVGLERHDIGYLRGGTPEQNATEMRLVLEGTPGPLRDFTLINAGAALVAWGGAPDLTWGVTMAAKSIDSGAALAKLDAFVRATNELAAPA
ncbi:MAG TPA: anthranilate phosphoribosyltransferase [Dehalococcoidia bacterium]|nr:anthranilate phosphoribosyltransferase [Dehalococcoidia bacterium]